MSKKKRVVRDKYPRAFDDEVNMRKLQANFARQLYTDDGSEGTPPAEGTRRALIRDATRSLYQRVLSLVERLRRTEEDLKTEQHRVASEDRDEEARGRLPRAVGIEAIGWISAELAARSGAWEGNAPDWFPEPPEWLELWDKALAAVGAKALGDEAMARGANALTEGIEKNVDLDLTENEERLYEEREQARAGESTLMEQRNAALHLLRWLIGDLIPPLVPLSDDGGDED